MAENELADLSLSDLGDINMDELEAKSFGDILPKFLGEFECISAEKKAIEDDGGKVKMFMVEQVWKVLGIHEMLDKEFTASGVDPSTLIGKEHKLINIFKTIENVQYFKGDLKKYGVENKGSLQGYLDALVGTVIKAQTTKRKNKDDEDKFYPGFAMDKIKILQKGGAGSAGSEAAAS